MKWNRIFNESDEQETQDEVLTMLNSIRDNSDARSIRKDIEKIISKYSTEKIFRDYNFEKPKEYMRTIKQLIREKEISDECDCFFGEIRNVDWVYTFIDSCERREIDELAEMFEAKFPDYEVSYNSTNIDYDQPWGGHDSDEWGYISLTKK